LDDRKLVYSEAFHIFLVKGKFCCSEWVLARFTTDWANFGLSLEMVRAWEFLIAESRPKIEGRDHGIVNRLFNSVQLFVIGNWK
jgi:hypothetical protein